MLTKDQLKKLEKLTKDPKYGSLLKAAIVGWKRNKVCNKTWGITIGVDGKYERSDNFKGCCLLGAALIGRKPKTREYFYGEILKRYNIGGSDFSGIIEGFDNADRDVGTLSAYKFAEKVREIVLP